MRGVERKKRIAVLETEIAELAYVEEALVAKGEDEQRSRDAPLAAVLGVRIAKAKSSRAA
jgi:hypothetical protein